jgi:hypothetical protein
MKYLITEDRLSKIFKSYMDSTYGLTYDENDNETMGGIRYQYIRDKRGNIVGPVIEMRKGTQFFFSEESMWDTMQIMFGEQNAYDLFLNYLRQEFPSLNIEDIG